MKDHERKRSRRNWTLPEKLAFYSRLHPGGCILWIGARNRKGYPRMRWQGHAQSANRLAWIERNGPIPAGMFVCHRCDTPLCINADHLFLGTAADNTADMMAKGRNRHRYGERHGTATITEDTARAILASHGRPHTVIALEFGVSKDIVRHIKRRRTWKHLDQLPSARAS